jgi:hypothetical protein
MGRSSPRTVEKDFGSAKHKKIDTTATGPSKMSFIAENLKNRRTGRNYRKLARDAKHKNKTQQFRNRQK